MEEFAEGKGYYRILGNDDVIEIRVKIGVLGFKKDFKNKEDPLLSQILTYCRNRNFVRVSQAVRDELFFK